MKVQTAAPPLSDARLVGAFTIEPVVRSSAYANVHPGKPYHSYRVSFAPSCKSGPCGGKWTYFWVSQDKKYHANNPGTYEPRQSGYLAKLANATFSYCSITGTDVLHHHSSATYEITVTDADVDKHGEWIATRIKGRVTEYSPSEGGCIGGSSVLDIEGAVGR